MPTIENFLQRCKEDPRYLLDRVIDFENSMHVTLVDYACARIEGDRPDTVHASVEVGLPAQRVGLAVLSDISTYTDNSLSPDFWISNWPGDVLFWSIFQTVVPERSTSLHPGTTPRQQSSYARWRIFMPCSNSTSFAYCAS